MSALAISFRHSVPAWAGVPEDDKRYRRILNTVLVVVAILCLLLLLMPKPVVDRTKPPELPVRLAKLLVEQPPPPKPQPKIEKDPTKPAPGPDATKPQPKPEPSKAAPVPEARVPQPNKPPGEIDAARRKAAGVGLLAQKDLLAEIRGAPMAAQLNQNIKQGPGVGTGVGVGVGAGTDAGTPDRAMITSNATGGSGGINTAGYSRNTGGGGLAGRATTLVEGVAGGGGGGGAGGGGAGGKGNGGNGGGAGGTLQRAAGGKASRSLEEIRIVIERNKGAIYAIYNRAMRDDPSLQGKVVVEFHIAPSGEVTECRLISSELKSPDLEHKLLIRLKQIDFGAKAVEPLIISWPIDFLPSS